MATNDLIMIFCINLANKWFKEDAVKKILVSCVLYDEIVLGKRLKITSKTKENKLFEKFKLEFQDTLCLGNVDRYIRMYEEVMRLNLFEGSIEYEGYVFNSSYLVNVVGGMSEHDIVKGFIYYEN